MPRPVTVGQRTRRASGAALWPGGVPRSAGEHGQRCTNLRLRLRKGELVGAGASDHYHVGGMGEIGVVKTKHFSNQPLRPIALDGAPYAFRGDDTEPSEPVGSRCRQAEQKEIAALRLGARALYAHEIGPTPKPSTAGEPGQQRSRRGQGPRAGPGSGHFL